MSKILEHILYNDYLNSQEFEVDILHIQSRSNVDQNYIDIYKNNAKEFINHFLEKQPKRKKCLLNKWIIEIIVVIIISFFVFLMHLDCCNENNY